MSDNVKTMAILSLGMGILSILVYLFCLAMRLLFWVQLQEAKIILWSGGHGLGNYWIVVMGNNIRFCNPTGTVLF